MSRLVDRRGLVIGGLASILAGGSVLALSPGSTALAQGPTDLDSLGLPTLDITVTTTGYDGVPAETPAGRYLVKASVTGGAPVQVVFLQPPSGLSAATLLEVIQASAGGGAPPEEIYASTWAGGIPTTFPGEVAHAVIDLLPGEWLVFGGGPGAPQEPVILEATGEMPADVPEPAADITVTISDDTLDVEGALTVGDHLLRIESRGTEPHQLLLLSGPDDLTEEDFGGFVRFDPNDPSSTPPAVTYPEGTLQPRFRSPALSDGVVQWAPLSFEPGEEGVYAALCPFPSADTGAGHAEQGQYAVFTVTPARPEQESSPVAATPAS